MFKKCGKTLLKLTALSLCLIAFIAHATVIDFKDMGDANAYIFSEFTGLNNDSQGALLVNENIDLTGYTVATLNGSDELAIATNGNLSVNGGDVNGLVSVAGTATINNTNELRSTSSNYEFDKNHFQKLSTNLSTSTNTINTVKWSELLIDTSTSRYTYITNIDSNQLFNFNSVKTSELALGARIVFNVSGENINLTAKDWLIKTAAYESHDAKNILFNFFEADTVTINTSIYGSVLAPNASVIGEGGMVNGQLIANSFTTGTNGGGTQLNQAVFNSDTLSFDNTVGTIPLPKTNLMFIGALFLILLRRLVVC